MRKSIPALAVTCLESRDVPAAVALGDGWADPANLTLSFAPDGTLIGSPPPKAVEVQTASTVVLGSLGLGKANQLLNPVTGAADGTSGKLTSGSDSRSEVGKAFEGVTDWQVQILRAFQTWVAATNINLGLTEDAKPNFGSNGAYQKDGRFGDIRIGGTRMDPAALANAVEVSPDNGTWAGDVLFNTAVAYRGKKSADGYDLFTVALHEAGHVFGLDHSDDPNSAMSESYRGVRIGLSGSDLATVRSYYGGARRADGFDLAGANDTQTSASVVSAAGNFTLTADLTTAADADWYAFRLPANKRSFEVRLDTAGLSLLTARLTVVDAFGREVGTAVSLDPTRGDLKVGVSGATAGGTYYLKVTAAGDTFGVGRYKLTVAGLGKNTTDVTPVDGPPAQTANAAPPPADQPVLASGTLTQSAGQSQSTLNMASSGLFDLSASATANVSGASLIVEVFDANGQKVLSFTQAADGSTASKSAYLAAGRYTVRVSAVVPLLSASNANVQFTLRGGVETDPMGTYKPGASTSPYSSPSSSSTASNSTVPSDGTQTSTTTNSNAGTQPYSY